MNQSTEDGGQVRLDEQFYNLLQNENLEVATVNDRDVGNAKRVDKTSFQEKTFHKMKQKEVATLVKDLSWDDRYEWLSYQRLKGNNLFRLGEYDQAIQVYMEMAVGLDLSKDNLEVQTSLYHQRFNIMRSDFQVTLLNNLAICYKKKQDYTRAIKFHEQAINCDSQVPQSYLKRAYTYLEMGEVSLCSQDISRCKDLYQSNPNPDLFREIKQIVEKLQEINRKEQKVYQKMFETSKAKQQPTVAHQNEGSKPVNGQHAMNGHDGQDGRIEQEPEQRNMFVNAINSIVNFGKQLFGCKKLFIDDEEETELIYPDQDYDEHRDQSSNFLI